MTAIIRQLCPSDRRFVTGLIYEPDNKAVVGQDSNRAFPVVAKDIKVILQGLLTDSSQVLNTIMKLFSER